jgi:hypothetical protein
MKKTIVMIAVCGGVWFYNSPATFASVFNGEMSIPDAVKHAIGPSLEEKVTAELDKLTQGEFPTPTKVVGQHEGELTAYYNKFSRELAEESKQLVHTATKQKFDADR